MHIKIFLPALCRYFLIFSGMICDYGKHMPSPYGHSLNVLDSAQDEIQIGYYWVHNLPCSYFAFSVLPDICWISWYASSLGWKTFIFLWILQWDEGGFSDDIWQQIETNKSNFLNGMSTSQMNDCLFGLPIDELTLAYLFWVKMITLTLSHRNDEDLPFVTIILRPSDTQLISADKRSLCIVYCFKSSLSFFFSFHCPFFWNSVMVILSDYYRFIMEVS